MHTFAHAHHAYTYTLTNKPNNLLLHTSAQHENSLSLYRVVADEGEEIPLPGHPDDDRHHHGAKEGRRERVDHVRRSRNLYAEEGAAEHRTERRGHPAQNLKKKNTQEHSEGQEKQTGRRGNCKTHRGGW